MVVVVVVGGGGVNTLVYGTIPTFVVIPRPTVFPVGADFQELTSMTTRK